MSTSCGTGPRTRTTIAWSPKRSRKRSVARCASEERPESMSVAALGCSPQRERRAGHREHREQQRAPAAAAAATAASDALEAIPRVHVSAPARAGYCDVSPSTVNGACCRHGGATPVPVFPAGKPKRRISPKNASFSGGGASGDGGSSVRIGMPGVAQWRVSNDGTPWASSAPVPGAA